MSNLSFQVLRPEAELLPCFWLGLQIQRRRGKRVRRNFRQTNILPAAVFGTLVLTLGGCGGTSSSNAFVSPPSEGPTTPATPSEIIMFNKLKARGQQLSARIDPVDVTPEANMPVRASAAYSGVASYAEAGNIPPGLTEEQYRRYLIDNPSIVSNVNLDANFETGQVNGQLTGFRDLKVGDLYFAAFSINGKITGNSFALDLINSVGGPPGSPPTIGNLSGVFRDATAENNGGPAENVTGLIEINVGSGSSQQQLGGVFTAE
jgi:hypothetical protein